MKKSLFFLLLFCAALPVGVWAQAKSNIGSGTPCSEMENKDARKLYEKGIDKKKYEFRERVEFIKQALEAEPEYAEALYQAALYHITIAKGENKSYKPAEKYLLDLIRVCPTYNPYAYFYLGQIAYGSNNLPDAAKYMKEFLKDAENAKSDEDYQTAENILKESEFLGKIMGNPVPFDPVPVPSVCTNEDEYLAMLSPDNEQIYFTHRYQRKTRDELVPRMVEEFSVSYFVDGAWSKVEALDPPFNAGDNYGGATFSLDNQRMFITICKPGKNGYNNCDIWMSEMRKNGWSQLVNLGPSVNTPDGWEAQPSLAGDGKTLYFASARADSRGMDLYKSVRQPDGSWSQAVNLGPAINTDGNEKSPFVHSDSQTLYFSSDGHPGVGGFDIFFSKMDDKGNWGKPSNIGYPINTEKDEVGFMASTDGHKGYFSSNTLKGKGKGGYDVFYFDLYPEARPEKILFLKGKITNDDDNGMPATELEVKTTASKTVTKIEVDSLTGKYAGIVTLKKGDDAILTVKKQGFGFSSQYIKSGDTTVGRPLKVEMTLKEVKPGATFTINDINYKTNSADLQPESFVVIEELADYLEKNPSLKIEIRGHTDNVGNPQANMALSTDRAFTVYDVLQKKGVSKSRLSFKGFGSTKPVAENTTEAGRAKNRRTEFVVLSN